MGEAKILLSIRTLGLKDDKQLLVVIGDVFDSMGKTRLKRKKKWLKKCDFECVEWIRID